MRSATAFKTAAGYMAAYKDEDGQTFVINRPLVECALGLRKPLYPTRAEAEADARDYLKEIA